MPWDQFLCLVPLIVGALGLHSFAAIPNGVRLYILAQLACSLPWLYWCRRVARALKNHSEHAIGTTDNLALVTIFLSGLAVSYCLLELSELKNNGMGVHPRAMLLLSALLCPLIGGLPASCWLARGLFDRNGKRSLFVTTVWTGLTAPFVVPLGLSLLSNILVLSTAHESAVSPVTFSFALRIFQTCGMLLSFQALRMVSAAGEAKRENLSKSEWVVVAIVIVVLGICTELFWRSMYR